MAYGGGLHVFGSKSYGKLTQTAGTIITRLIEPKVNAVTRLTSLWYTCSTTAHTLTVMRPFGVTTFTAAAAASQAVVNIARDPGTYSAFFTATPTVANNILAGSDFVVYQMADGTFALDTVASVSALAVTLTTNLGTGGVAAGGKLWWYGIITDTSPHDGKAHPQYTLAASVVTKLGTDAGESISGWFESVPGALGSGLESPQNQPLICHSGNATAAGVLEKVNAVYTKY